MTQFLKHIISIFVFISSIFMPQAQGLFADTEIPSSAKIMIVLKEDALTVQAKNVSSAQVLQAIEKKLGFEMILHSDLPAEAGNWSFNQVPFLEAIRNIVGDHPHLAILYDDANPRKVSKVWIFEKGIDQMQHPASIQLDPGTLFVPEPTILESFASEDLSESLEDPDHALDQDRAFIEKLGDIDPDIRLQVVNRLGENSAEWVIPILGQVLFSDADSEVRLAAVEALKNRDSQAADEFLKVALRDESKRVRQVAMKNLR